MDLKEASMSRSTMIANLEDSQDRSKTLPAPKGLIMKQSFSFLNSKTVMQG